MKNPTTFGADAAFFYTGIWDFRNYSAKKPENTVRFRVFRHGWIFLFFGGYFPAMESVSTRTLGDPKVVEPRGMGSVRLEATAVILVRRS